jgi:hypothetical protein
LNVPAAIAAHAPALLHTWPAEHLLTVGTYAVPAELQTLHVVPDCTEFGVQYEGAATTAHVPALHVCPDAQLAH